MMLYYEDFSCNFSTPGCLEKTKAFALLLLNRNSPYEPLAGSRGCSLQFRLDFAH